MATDNKSCIHLKMEHISADTHTAHVLTYIIFVVHTFACHRINKDEMEGACGMSAYRVFSLNLKETGPLEDVGKVGE
jgi:hypothetical protein